MHATSTAFKDATASSYRRERVLVRFAGSNMFFDGSDIHQSGLRVSEAVNTDDNLTIGRCASSELSMQVWNETGLLSGFEFGAAQVSLGLRVATEETAFNSPTTAIRYGLSNQVTITGHAVAPYLKANGMATAAQPPFSVKALLGVGLNVYAISLNGDVWQAYWDDAISTLVPASEGEVWDDLASVWWDDLATTTWATHSPYIEIGAFLADKAKKWAETGRGLWLNGNMLYEFYPDRVDTYEYVPLGVFDIKKPTVTRNTLIGIEAYDLMSRFETDATTFWNGITYPITLGQIFSQLCSYVGVSPATITFINSDRSFSNAPVELTDVTCREILSWIAEAAGGYARMTRDGEVELAWFGTQSVTIEPTQTFSVERAEYTVARIDKLQVSGAADDVGVVIGEGQNGYQILDNPFLYGNNDTEIRTYATPIYNRLAAFAEYSPIALDALCDWSIQAGDIISVTIKGETYTLPIFRQTITWSGRARVAYESTGDPMRPVMNATNRRIWAQDRAMYILKTSVDGLSSEVSNKVDGNEIISKINQSAEAISIQASKINLNGAITANQYFKINTNGSMEAIAGNIGGFLIGQTQLSAAGLILNASTGAIEIGNGAAYISAVGGFLQIVHTSNGIMLNAPTIQLGSSSGQDVNIVGTLYYQGSPFPTSFPVIRSGTVTASSASAATISYSGFSSTPVVIVSYSTTGANSGTGAWGALKVYNKSSSSASVIISGSSPTTASVDWIAIGT